MQLNLRWFQIGLLFLSLVIIIVGCSSNAEYSNDSANRATEEANEELAMDDDTLNKRGSVGSSPAERKDTQGFNSSDRMMIYNAYLSLEVKDYDKVEAQIQEEVNSLGGYVLESSIYSSREERINGKLVVKVPQQSFHRIISDVESNSVKVLDRRVQGNDVTEEYVDLDSRLKSKRVVEERLLGFMKEAEKTEDLLKISNDLSKVQEEIEQILGRMNYLQTNVNFSTVTIDMTEKLINVSTIQGQEGLNTWMQIKSLFMDSINGVLSFFSSVLIFLIGRSPIIVPMGVVALLIVYLIKKNRNTNPPFEG